MSAEKTEVETFFGRCRCCLTYGYLKNMWVEHQFEGEAEIYAEMLVQCFALALEHSEETMEQDQICEQCICRLRDANDFKKVVMDSQEELLQEMEEERNVNIKEERLQEDLLDIPDSDGDTAETIYIDAEYTTDSMTIVKDETEYEEIEYLEEEDTGVANDAVDADSSHLKDKCKPAITRKKHPRQPEPDEEAEAEEVPKRKWPKKLPKSERLKTYKQYSEADLRKCLEEVRNNKLSPSEASLIYDIPKKTICAKIKLDPNDVLIDNTTKSKMQRSKKEPRKKPSIFKTKASFMDGKIKKLIELKKLKAKTLINEAGTIQDDDTDKETKVIEINLEPQIEEKKVPVNAAQVRTRYKAIVNDKFKKENKIEPEKFEINEMNKHKDNIRTILQNSNATIIRGFWGYRTTGYCCNFCAEQREIPSELKQHNLEVHSNVGDEAIKVKYVSDLVIRLDITDLKCKLCNASINSLEKFMDHLTKIHSQRIHTDIKNHIIPFQLNTDPLQCCICKKEYKHFKLLSEHMSEHYRNYECSFCERAFINKQSMQTHSYRHKKGVFKCAHCPKVFDSRPNRSVHERVVHALSNKTRKCAYCSEKFGTKDLVQNHEVKVHGVEPPVFSCQACNKSYTSQSSLLTHRRRYHLMIRPHKCDYCEMAFFSKIELSSHTVTHTKTRDFKCDLCTKSFGTRCSLNQHIRGHMDDRRFKCDICDRTFVHRTGWRVHMRNMHSRIV